ncbi:MAG: hypothetical protein Q9191_002499 [Dirinaria sp. TL-2023a]
MKYLPLRDFDDVTDALNFDTADCHVIGGCDLYTTKAAGGDKKLYKAIEQTLESQYASLLRFTASLSPSQATMAAGALNLSRASPFGSLSQSSSRRTFAYLIATLNASHPDYDFSHLLRPTDFRREKSLQRVMNTLDTTLYNLRPRPPNSFGLGNGSNWSASMANIISLPSPGKEIWNPRMWRLIDNEMSLEDCSIYCYQPEEDPYDGEEGAIWSFNYFFFNKTRKRVCYIHLRGLSILSHMSAPKTPVKTKRSVDNDWNLDEAPSSKRARYWLGDQAAEATSEVAEDDEEYSLVDDEDLNKSESVQDDDLETVVDDEPHEQIVLSADESKSPTSEPSLPSTERSRSKSTVRATSEGDPATTTT